MGRSRPGKTDSCGCALSAKFMVAGLTASAAYFGWQFGTDAISLPGVALRVALATVVAAGIGKALGILRYQWRSKALSRSA
jgi:hypothetical protein